MPLWRHNAFNFWGLNEDLNPEHSIVCDVMVSVGHSSESLAGKVDPQLFSSRVPLIKLTSLG